MITTLRSNKFPQSLNFLKAVFSASSTNTRECPGSKREDPSPPQNLSSQMTCCELLELFNTHLSEPLGQLGTGDETRLYQWDLETKLESM